MTNEKTRIDSYSQRLVEVCKALLSKGKIANQRDLIAILYPESDPKKKITVISSLMNGRINYSRSGRAELTETLAKDFGVNAKYMLGDDIAMFSDEMRESIAIPFATVEKIITRLSFLEVEVKHLKEIIGKKH